MKTKSLRRPGGLVWTPRKSFLLKTNNIYRLVNSFLYSLDYAFIHCREDGFHLMALHQNKVHWNKTYESLQEAKMAFLNQFQHKAWIASIQPQWSHQYKAYKYWLKDKYKQIAKSQAKKKPKQKTASLVDHLIQKTPRGTHSPGALFPLTTRENPDQPLKAYEYK